MNHGIDVVLPLGQDAGTKALLPPRPWTSSAESSCSAPVAVMAATQSLLSSMTSGALAPPRDEGMVETFVPLTWSSRGFVSQALAASLKCCPGLPPFARDHKLNV